MRLSVTRVSRLTGRSTTCGSTLLGPILMATMFVAFSAIEWFRWYRDDRPHPLLFSAIAGIGIIYAIFRTSRSWKRLRSLKLGRDGERAVALVPPAGTISMGK